MNNETYLGVVAGKEIFCDLKDKSSVIETLKYLESLTGEKWNTFKEQTGNKNLVFYRESMYEARRRYLHFKDTSTEVELPLNCSSCHCMFNECKLSEGFTLGDNFNTSNVEDMSDMFSGCAMPEGFSLVPNFDTSKVRYMHNMFRGCTMREGFTLGERFDTSTVEDMGFMFSECTLPKGFTLGEKFSTFEVQYMCSMFYVCELPEDFVLNDKFDISKVMDTGFLFSNCILPEGKREKDFKSEFEIVEWLKSRASNKDVESNNLKKITAF